MSEKGEWSRLPGKMLSCSLGSVDMDEKGGIEQACMRSLQPIAAPGQRQSRNPTFVLRNQLTSGKLKGNGDPVGKSGQIKCLVRRHGIVIPQQADIGASLQHANAFRRFSAVAQDVSKKNHSSDSLRGNRSQNCLQGVRAAVDVRKKSNRLTHRRPGRQGDGAGTSHQPSRPELLCQPMSRVLARR